MQTRCRAATGGVDVANHGVGVATATPTRSNLTKLGSSGSNRIRFSPIDVVQRDTQQTDPLRQQQQQQQQQQKAAATAIALELLIAAKTELSTGIGYAMKT